MNYIEKSRRDQDLRIETTRREQFKRAIQLKRSAINDRAHMLSKHAFLNSLVVLHERAISQMERELAQLVEKEVKRQGRWKASREL